MTRPVKTFIASVEDNLGWPYPDALVAIRHASVSSQDTYVSEDCKSNYLTDSLVDAVAYRANFWGNKAMQQTGKASRPLINKGNTEDPDLFIVDLEHLQSQQVLNSSMSPEDKYFRLIELDANRRFPN